MNTSAERYFVAPHAFVRVLNDQVFILDVRRDEYICVKDCRALAETVSGWPSRTGSVASRDVGGERSDATYLLLGRGVLADAGKSAEAADLALATDDWSDEWRTVTGRMTLLYILPFMLALLETVLLWRLPFEYRIRVVQRRGRKAAAKRTREGREIRRLTGIFLLLRAWAYTAQERCLFDSFVMSAFFNLCGYSPRFVIGIQAHPFVAHCWVQYENRALNELDTRARRYAPILVA